jgi:hypothetical protein
MKPSETLSPRRLMALIGVTALALAGPWATPGGASPAPSPSPAATAGSVSAPPLTTEAGTAEPSPGSTPPSPTPSDASTAVDAPPPATGRDGAAEVDAQAGIPAPDKFPFDPERDGITGSVDGVRVQGATVTVYGWVTTPYDPRFGRQIEVSTPSRGVTAVAHAVDRWDVAAVYPAYGSRTGFEATLELPRGGHELCVRVLVDTNSFPWQLLGCEALTVVSGEVLGNVDDVVPHRGGVSIRGWALQGGEVAWISVHAYVDGTWAGAFVADQVRADVGAVHPQSGARHGYAAELALAEGVHHVCVYGISRHTDEPNPVLGCRSASVPRQLPVGNVDQLTGLDDRATLTGWAFDPDTDAPISVHVYLDGEWAGSMVASDPRADVADAYNLRTDTHGFSLELALPLGRHLFCVYAINVGFGATNPLLGCGSVGVSLGAPFGHLEYAGFFGIDGRFGVSGWVIDPDTRDPCALEVVLDGQPLEVAVLPRPRSDVDAAYPTLRGSHGFFAEMSMPRGLHTVCVSAENVGVGSGDAIIGCRTFLS